MSGMSRRLVLALPLIVALAANANAESRRYSLDVDGMVCPLCAFSVKRALTALKGVQEVTVDLRRGKAVVTMADGIILRETDARGAIESARFKLRTFQEITGASPK